MSARETLLDYLESLPPEEYDAALEQIEDPALLENISQGLAEREQTQVVELAEAGDITEAIGHGLEHVQDQIGRSLTQDEMRGMRPYTDRQIATGETPDAQAAYHRYYQDTDAKPPSRKERMADAIEQAHPDWNATAEHPGEKPGEGSTAEERREWRRSQMAWNVENPETESFEEAA